MSGYATDTKKKEKENLKYTHNVKIFLEARVGMFALNHKEVSLICLAASFFLRKLLQHAITRDTLCILFLTAVVHLSFNSVWDTLHAFNN